jgi:hypothetical protein
VPIFEIGEVTISGAQPAAALADALHRIETPGSLSMQRQELP